jgi:hypothetical protein
MFFCGCFAYACGVVDLRRPVVELARADRAMSGAVDPPPWVLARRRRRRRYRLAAIAVPVVLVASAATVVLAKAAAYQPLSDGSTGVSILDYPGLPAAQGARSVNTFGNVRQDVYIPPQREGYTFYLFADIANNGSRAITIESVGLPPHSGLTPAGPARYPPPGEDPHLGVPPANAVLHAVRLRAGGELLVAIPVRSWPCWMRHYAFDTVPSFDVTYKFLFFTRTVAIPWNSQNGEIILQGPAGRPGQPDVVCMASP